MLNRRLEIAYSTLLSLACLGPAHAAAADCDPSLTQVKTAFGYRDRGDRCEGVYIKEVSSTALTVASFTEVFEPYDLQSSEPLHLAWDRPPGNASVRLRAQSLRRRLYYRMDAVQQLPRRLLSTGRQTFWRL